ncbi:MAG: host-nuclease inhibitor Gam family protein [Alphaproteobacteria bacterium]
MATMAEIEKLTRAYAACRRAVGDAAAELNEDMASVKKRGLPRIRRLAEAEWKARRALDEALGESRDLFEKPKSRTFDEIKVGWEKRPGALSFADPKRVVALIRKHMPDRFAALVKVKESPVKKALGQLPVAELKRLGVDVGPTGEAVVIRPVQGDVEKLVAALLDQPADEEDDA